MSKKKSRERGEGVYLREAILEAEKFHCYISRKCHLPANHPHQKQDVIKFLPTDDLGSFLMLIFYEDDRKPTFCGTGYSPSREALLADDWIIID